MNYLRILLLMLLFLWALSSCKERNNTATVKTGLDLSKEKTVLNNYGSANASETLQPYEAFVIEF